MNRILARPGRGSLLHLDSSAGPGGTSVTRGLTARFAETWQQRHGRDGYRYRDLAADPVPLIGPAFVALGRRMEQRGTVPPEKVGALLESAEEEREWAATLPLVEEVLAAETVLIGAPMYNFSVPAALKAWIDRITFPGAFEGGALRDTLVVVATARGGGYGPGAPREGYDFQAPYLRGYFTNLGVAEDHLHLVHAELTLSTLVPAMADLRPLAADSLTAAETALAELAGSGAVTRLCPGG